MPAVGVKRVSPVDLVVVKFVGRQIGNFAGIAYPEGTVVSSIVKGGKLGRPVVVTLPGQEA